MSNIQGFVLSTLCSLDNFSNLAVSITFFSVVFNLLSVMGFAIVAGEVCIFCKVIYWNELLIGNIFCLKVIRKLFVFLVGDSRLLFEIFFENFGLSEIERKFISQNRSYGVKFRMSYTECLRIFVFSGSI